MKNKKDSVVFFLLIVSIFVFVFIHHLLFLFFVFLFFVFLSRKISIKVLKAILFFNASITVGYAIESLLLGRDFLDYLLIFNLRVFDITFMTLFVSSKINLIKAVSFSSSLQFLLIATLTQIQSFVKTFEDFKLAIESRTLKKLGQRDKKNFISSMFYFFLKKSLHNSKERTLALKARGFFD